MPWVFVLIWIDRLRRRPPRHAARAAAGLPGGRYALSVACFGVWVALSGAAWPREPGAVAAPRRHRHADACRLPGRRLGGREGGHRRRHGRAAGRPAAGAHRDLAEPASTRRDAPGRRRVQWLGLAARARRPRPGGLRQARRRRGRPRGTWRWRPGAVLRSRRHAVPEALRCAVRRAHRQHRAVARCIRRHPAVCAARDASASPGIPR